MADHLIVDKTFWAFSFDSQDQQTQRSAATIGINMSNQLALIIISILVPFLVSLVGDAPVRGKAEARDTPPTPDFPDPVLPVPVVCLTFFL